MMEMVPMSREFKASLRARRRYTAPPAHANYPCWAERLTAFTAFHPDWKTRDVPATPRVALTFM